MGLDSFGLIISYRRGLQAWDLNLVDILLFIVDSNSQQEHIQAQTGLLRVNG